MNNVSHSLVCLEECCDYKSLVFSSAAEGLALSLEEALSSGDAQEAVKLCQRLSQLSVPVSIRINSQAYPQDSIRWGQN